MIAPWPVSPVYAILRGGDASMLLLGTKPSVPARDEPPTTSTLLYAQQDASGLGWRVQTTLTIPATPVATPPTPSPPATTPTPAAKSAVTVSPTATAT